MNGVFLRTCTIICVCSLRVDWDAGFLDEGTFGKVACGQLRTRPSTAGGDVWMPVAVKTLKEMCIDGDVHLENLMKELGMMIKVGCHDNVIKLIGFCTSNEDGSISYPK